MDINHLIDDIVRYAEEAGRTPQWVLRESIKAGWGNWARWISGEGSPTYATGDRIRAWMAANPPVKADADATPTSNSTAA